MFPKLIMFDLDGTLIDSKKDIITNVNAALVKAGRKPETAERIADLIGQGSHYLFRQILGEETDTNEVIKVVSAFRERYLANLVVETTLYPGAAELLLHFSQTPKVIVTNKGQLFADRIIEHFKLSHHFKGIYGLEAFAKAKPHPMPIIEVCRKFAIEPRDTLFVGDSDFDIAASRAAGSVSALALYGYGGDVKEKADHKIEKLLDLTELFR